MKNLFRTRTSTRRRSTQRHNFLRLEQLEQRSVLTGFAPVALNDHYDTLMDTSVGDHGPGILANDTDAEGDSLTSNLFSGPANGTLGLNSDGSFLYTPNAGFVGTDSFMYYAHDGESASLLAAVTIEVGDGSAGAPVSADDSFNVEEDSVLNIGFSEGVLGNDTDPDGDAMSAAVVDGPTHGTLSLASDGSFTYIPEANYAGADSFTYVASDGSNEGNLATVTISIDPVNDGPTSANDAAEVDEDGVLTGASVLGNDADPDGDTLTPTLVSGPLHGTLELNSDGTFTYTPTADFNGLDGFSYKVSDGTIESEVATVTITVNPVNDLPTSINDEYTTAEDTPLDIPAPGVLENDEDIDADDLAAILVSPPQFGTLSLNSDGSFLYTPNADFSGTDGFSYLAGDGTGASEVAGVTIHVTAVNDGPTAVADAYSTDEETPLVVDLPGILGNDTDPEGDSLAATLVTGPANGTLTLNPDGSFTYTPAEAFNGEDSFTYSVSDGEASSEAAVTITINAVNDAPVAGSDAYDVDEDSVLVVDAPGLLENDSDADGDALAAAVVSGPANGTVDVQADGSFIYTPNENFNGADSFTYSASDGTTSTEATVSITVNPVNDAPAATGDAYEVDEDSVLTVDAPGVLGNDTDADGDPLSATVVTGPAHGTLALNADGSFSYTPAANFNGSDSFTYAAGDGTEGSEATVTITVNPFPDAPAVSSDAYSVGEDLPLVVDAGLGVLANDFDPEGLPLTATLVTGPTNGTLALNPDGSFSYTPAANWNGTDSFTYLAQNGTGEDVEGTVSIVVEALNDMPLAADDSFDVPGGELSGTVMGNDSDIDGDALSARLLFGPHHGALTLNADGTFSFTAEEGYLGDDEFFYQLNDGKANSAVAKVTLHVQPESSGTPIVATDDAYTAEAETPLVVDAPGVLTNDADPEGDSLSVAMVAGPAHGTLALNPDGSFTYTPAIGFAGTDTFTYEASDGTVVSNVATVTIEVGSLTNTRPTAGNDTYTVEQDSTLDVPADQGLLLDDSDPDGDAITAGLFSNPQHGAVTLNADGSFTYTPTAGYVGLDSFLYSAFDGELHSILAAVTIHVTAAEPDSIPEPEPEPCEPEPEPSDCDSNSASSSLLAADDADDTDELLDTLVDPAADDEVYDLVICDGLWVS